MKAPAWALIALLVANVALATGPSFVRVADVGPVAAGFWRLLIGLPLLTALALAIERTPVKDSRTGISLGLIGIVVASGALFAADLASWHLGIVATKLANATLFGNAASLLYPLYGYLIARAWPTRSEGAALGLALVGALVLLGRSYEASPQNLVGDLLCLLAGVFYTAYLVAIARARSALGPLTLIAASTCASVLPMLGFALLLGETIWPGDWRPLVAIALFSQVIGQGLMTAILGRVAPVVIGVTLLTQPIVGATIGWVVFGERLGLLDIIGAALIATALVLVSIRPRPTAPA